jgi:glycerophosphoryl diester phosphodiesterase
MSFSYVALNRVKKLAPDLDVVMLVDRMYNWEMTRNLMGEDWIVGPGIELLRENRRFRKQLTRTGRDVHVWVVNSSEDLDLCLDVGVQAVITDSPAAALEHLTGRV